MAASSTGCSLPENRATLPARNARPDQGGGTGWAGSVLAPVFRSAPRATGDRVRGIARPGAARMMDSGGTSLVTTVRLGASTEYAPIPGARQPQSQRRACSERDRGIIRLGAASITDPEGTSLVTTQFAPIIALSPITTPPSKRAPG